MEAAIDNGETGLGEYLKAVAGAIVADGRVDFDETTRLLEILKPLGEFDAKAVELRKAVEDVRADGVVTAEESAKLVALIKDFMAEAAHWSLAACPACGRTVPVSSLQGATRRCPVCGAEIPCGGQGTDRPTGGGNGLFREAALEKAAHPFSKEQIPGVFRLPVAITAAILAVVITSFCVWCGVGSIAENVHGSGILMHKGRYVALTSPGEGLVVSFDVKVGDSVTNGQKVGVLYSKTDVEQLFVANRRLERLKSDYDRIAAECRAVADKKKSQHAQFLRQLDDFDKRITDASLDAERILREVEYRATIVADASGRVSNVNVAPGDRVRVGDSLARLSVATGADGWELVAYFSAAEARKLAKGMTAVVTPSTVKAEREGGIRGQVMAVGTDFETPESIQCDFRNDAFTQWIMSRTDGMPVKVRMLLESDPASASGFRWTGGRGPDIRIADGTVAAVAATVRRHRPAKLAFAKVIRYATGDGEMEEGILGN